MLVLPLFYALKYGPCYSFLGRNGVIVSVAGGTGMSCLPSHLLCHSLPVKSLTQLRVNKDQATTHLSLGTNSPMATSKANSSNRIDFIVNLARIWLNTRLTLAVVMKHPSQKERREERAFFQTAVPVTFHHCGKLQAGTSNSLVRLHPQPRAERNGRTHTRLPACAQTQIPAALGMVLPVVDQVFSHRLTQLKQPPQTCSQANAIPP